ncbi:amidohydrolase family protein [Salegentibacter sp.]|uniref:N-acyl-D-amino-acid deacylase family protein n=1 Tax=Salegentibacter sp. TaxID=1903072 RepID=UPI00356876E5
MKNLLLLLLFAPGILLSQNNDVVYDLLIRNATLVDGSGKDKFKAHVLVRNSEIVQIERDTSLEFSAEKTIDADGLVLSPGFIDTHSHGNPLETPGFKNFLAMGVTTITLGQDGYSPSERDLNQWMDEVQKIQPATNIAMFAGHNTLRQLSGVNYDTLPGEEGLVEMEKLLQNAMDAGVFGMTTGLEYNPGNFSGEVELERLAKIVGKNGGLIMSHMRNEDDSELENSIKELLAQGKHCPVHISHIKSVYGKGEPRATEIISLLEEARAEGIEVTADLYPYSASYTGIAIVFPDWAKKPNDYESVLKTRKAELQEFLRNKIADRNGPEATLIGSGKFKGKSLEQISKELNKPFEDVLIEDIGPYGAGGAYFIMDDELQQTLMQHELVNICSDGSPTMRHPRGYGSFAKIIETYVMGEKMLSLEQAIHKMTGMPAEILGIEDRGLIKEGYKADLLLFDPSEIKEMATYEEPHKLAEGFKYVLVNGKIAKDGSEFSGERNGKFLKRP